MAESDSNTHPQMAEEENLKYLEFVQSATFQAFVIFSKMYVYAKDNSGPLKPGVETVEGTVKMVVGPVYDKYHSVPAELLKFADRKVDFSVNELDKRVPPLVKKVSFQALSAAQNAPSTARAVASELHPANVVDRASGVAKNVYSKYEPAAKGLYSKYEPTAKGLYSKYEPTAKGLYSKYEPTAKGLYSKYEPTAKGLYSKYEPVAEQYAASAWHSLNRLPLFPRVAQAVVPKAAYCSEKYNQTVASSAEKGYKVAAYLPLVPTEKIAKVFTASGGEGDVAAH